MSIVVSDVTGSPYEESESVFFRNPKQSAFYMFRGARLVDLFSSDDLKCVWVFSKTDHDKYKMEWKTRERENG